jgi:hypothetical protein
MVTLGSLIHSLSLLGGKMKGLSANEDAEAIFFSLARDPASRNSHWQKPSGNGTSIVPDTRCGSAGSPGTAR